jgi:hypothetical protein
VTGRAPQLTELLQFARDEDAVVCAQHGPLARNLDDLGVPVQGPTHKGWYACIFDFELFVPSEQRCRAGLLNVVANTALV